MSAVILLGLLSVIGCTTSGPFRQFRANGSEILQDEIRQLTFAGRRSGEGYFDPAGENIVFQSERDPGNPFYQIFKMNLGTGETKTISNGRGKTTCGWIDPHGDIFFASTHLDPDAAKKQASELEERASDKTRRYAWSYDPHYDLFKSRNGEDLERLTTAFGYDAEASVSPDGQHLVFASNRHAYTADLAPEDRERLADDPSYFIDLYRLDLRSGELQRLTSTPGYDGGPFFSPDGQRIVWRRFSEDGTRAEIMTIAFDGTDERTLTTLGAMSWAPYYHPSGDYVIFSTNLHGFDNSELYLVRTRPDGRGDSRPVRVSSRAGFDGLPAFSPDGEYLLWTSNQTASKKSQLFLSNWNDRTARKMLGLAPIRLSSQSGGLPQIFLPLPATRRSVISPGDLESHVRALTDEQTEGRRAGTPGEVRAGDYIARFMKSIGLLPADPDGDFLHAFEFTSGVSLGEQNELRLGSSSEPASRRLEIDSDWRPVAFSRSGEIPASPIVFVGYGLVSPAHADSPALDPYADLEIEDRWVMAFRGLPPSLEGSDRQHLQRYASLRYKAMIARDHGARGILFVSGPLGMYRDELVPLRFDATLAGTRIGVLSIGDGIAAQLLSTDTRGLEKIQRQAGVLFPSSDGLAEILQPFEIRDQELAGRVDLKTVRASGNNVLGRLQVGAQPSTEIILLGAHYDHLGRGQGSGSLASGDQIGEIHFGADDNASGVAVLLEIAEDLTQRRDQGEHIGTRDFMFAAWSGEELGLLGSARWVAENIDPHTAGGAGNAHGTGNPQHTEMPHSTPVGTDLGIVAYLNFDMVGRLRENVVIQGIGSSPAWPKLLEMAAVPLGLSIVPQTDSYLPTDATSFYTNGIPILSAFTGIHSEYHTPLDTLDRLNFPGAAKIARLGRRVAQALSLAKHAPLYQVQEAPSTDQTRSGFRVFLGTVPDYAQSGVVGVRLSGVKPSGPADKAGLRGGDIIVEVDERPIDNLYDYTYALEALRIGQPAKIVILRGTKRLTLEIVPASRD
jgi:Tol biopolymer transport system component